MSVTVGQDAAPTLSRNLYARLAEGVSLHTAPKYGILKRGDPECMEWTSAEACQVLAQCDGSRTVAQILAARLSDPQRPSDDELCGALIELARFAGEGLVALSAEPDRIKLTTTGSLAVHYPTGLQVELTTACNLDCSYCYRRTDASAEQGRLPTGKLLAIIEELRGLGLQSVELTGGEPLVHPDFARILQFCGERLALVGLLTNGTLLTETVLEQMLPFRDKMVVSISLDSHRPEVHDRRRAMSGAFERSTEAVRLLARHGFLTRVTMTTDEETWPDVEATLLLARELGATRFGYSPVMPFGRAKGSPLLWAADFMTVFAQEKELRDKYSDFLHLMDEDSLLELQSPGGCGAGYRTYAMDPAGNVRPCVTFEEQIAVIGCLATQSPQEVFDSELPKAFASIVVPQAATCEGCAHIAFCQNCALRGLVAAGWVGEANCKWLQTTAAGPWRAVVARHSL